MEVRIMSWIRIWVHLVFSTLNRDPLITKELKERLFTHIRDNALKKDIWLDRTGGGCEHVHCLISLKGEQTISKVAQLIKGESSLWLNKNYFSHSKFNWQDDYWAVSVSESHVEQVRSYIENQEDHHKNRTFKEEVDEFMSKYGWSIVNKYKT